MGEIIYRTLRETVVDAIRKKILKHELQPGMRIIEQEISEEFGVSRGPIREAFRQLEQEGLVDYTRNMGCSVRNITLDDVFEVYMLRGTYELIAAKLYKGMIPDTAFKDMEQALDHMKHMNENDFIDIVTYDNLFHRAMIAHTGLPRLIQAWTNLDYAAFFGYYTETADSKVIAGLQYQVHKELMDKYHSGDINTICDTIAGHYTGSIDRQMKQQGLSKDDIKFSLDIIDWLHIKSVLCKKNPSIQ